jgi:hypothetical protein
VPGNDGEGKGAVTDSELQWIKKRLEDGKVIITDGELQWIKKRTSYKPTTEFELTDFVYRRGRRGQDSCH